MNNNSDGLKSESSHNFNHLISSSIDLFILLLIICPIITLLAGFLLFDNFKGEKIRIIYFLLIILILIQLIAIGTLISRILDIKKYLI